MALKDTIAPRQANNPVIEIMQNKDLENIGTMYPLSPTRRGRPNGKRSSDDYVTTTLILRRDLKLDAQDKARRAGQDLSVVVNELLERYLKENS